MFDKASDIKHIRTFHRESCDNLTKQMNRQTDEHYYLLFSRLIIKFKFRVF